jgi:hypothetical protein
MQTLQEKRHMNTDFVAKLVVLFLVVMLGYFHRVYNLNTFIYAPKAKISLLNVGSTSKD